MCYRVEVIAEHELPRDQGWALIEVDAQTTVFAVKSSAFTVESVCEGWAAYRKLLRSARRLRPVTGSVRQGA